MRNLILWNMVSLDGHFEGPKHDIEWFAFDPDLEAYIVETQLSAGMLLFGRATYEVLASYWPSATGTIAEFMNRVPKAVASRTLARADWHPTTVVGDDVADQVARWKREPGGDIFVYGSANLCDTLIRHRLVDEFRIGVSPLLLGSGVPLFKGDSHRQPLRLDHCQRLGSGLVILHYRPDDQVG